MPGLGVVIPSAPRRAYGLLLAAIRDPDPVVFLEPKRVCRRVKEDIEDDGVAPPLDACFVLREGGDMGRDDRRDPGGGRQRVGERRRPRCGRWPVN